MDYGIHPRVPKQLKGQTSVVPMFWRYIRAEFLRKDLILTYITLVFSIVGMLYQCIDVLSSYLEYPTLMNILEEREAARFPAMTTCLSPWYNLTMVCEKRNGQCSKKDVMLVLSYPKHAYFREWRDYGLSDPSVLFTCNMTSFMPDCPDFDCKDMIRHIYYKVPMMACYTLDLQRFLPRNHSYFNCQYTWSYELMVEARWNPKTTMSTMDMMYYPIFFHDSSVYAPEPMSSAAMRRDVFVDYTIAQQDWSRLKKPYHTDCWDYRERFGRKLVSIYQGWMSQLSCEQECRMAQELENCNCIRTVNEFSHFMDVVLCDVSADDKCSAIMTANNSFLYSKCNGICNSECSTTRYDARISGLRNYYPKNHKKKKSDDMMCGFSVAFSSATVEIYHLKPAMNSEMLLGIMAGFIGVWVGLAFSNVADYVGFLIPLKREKEVLLKRRADPLPPNYRQALYNRY
ncbi:uncharacterized protein LOC114828007 [Galendromus occidentalis]|uniref:Uncharacterized protein LOC114828007 n=1 Tax=Galendromus occidentalis TaxID=34638 RepID=A0AAJ7SCS9_9ACAR|nr:uncharacterized protein LOC114828007 [Galendromus occidentalis]